jgi:hypothetical protein
MIINLASAARVVALTALIPGACESQSAYEPARKKLKRAPLLLLLMVGLTGCSYSVSRDVLAYNVCMARHAQEAAVCDGPRLAYELDTTAFQATAAVVSPPSGIRYEAALAAAPISITPTSPRSNPVDSSRNP